MQVSLFSCVKTLTFCVQEQHMLIELDGPKNWYFWRNLHHEEQLCTIMTHKQNIFCAVDGHLCCLSHFITVISGDTNVIRRSGSNVLQLAVDKSLKAYQEGMDGVNRSDQYIECGSEFACKAHHKKWYKKSILPYWTSWSSIHSLLRICLQKK